MVPFSVQVEVNFYADKESPNGESLHVAFHPCRSIIAEKGGRLKRRHARTGINFVITPHSKGMIPVEGSPLNGKFFLPDNDALFEMVKAEPQIARLGLAMLEALKYTCNAPLVAQVPASPAAPESALEA